MKVIAALHHEDIKGNPEWVAKLNPYLYLYDWNGLEFSVAIKQNR